MPSKHGKHHRTPIGQIRRTHHLTPSVVERELGERIAYLDEAIRDARVTQRLRGRAHHRALLRR